MKKVLAGIALVAATLSAPAAAGEQDFVLVNNTGYTIMSVHVSQSAKQSWEEDILGEDVLPQGQRTTIRFSSRENACLWDLKVVYLTEESAEWQAINLCTVAVVALSYNEETGDTWAETE